MKGMSFFITGSTMSVKTFKIMKNLLQTVMITIIILKRNDYDLKTGGFYV